MHKILYSTQEVYSLLGREEVVLVDIRDSEAYRFGHIPGAVNLPEVFEYLCTADTGGLDTLHFTFQELFSRAGISFDRKVIFYEESLDSRYGSSCRGYWLLTYLGHDRAGILDGGYLAWLEENRPEELEPFNSMRAEFDIKTRPELIATKEDVLEAMGNPDVILLDNRDQEEWFGRSSSPYGIDYAPRKGRIPGAVWIEWYELMDRSHEIPGFKSVRKIRDICAARGIYPDSDIIIYCFKGSRAAHSYVAMILAGFTKVRIYFASWNEWARDFSLPIEK